jgi:hypothetical protein
MYVEASCSVLVWSPEEVVLCPLTYMFYIFMPT